MNTTLNIISLPYRKDRREALEPQIEEQGIASVTLWNGVTGLPTIIENIARAHKQIVQRAKENGWKNVIIGEDDLKFTAPGAWQYFLDQIPATYDLFLASIYTGCILPDQTVRDFSGLTLYSVHERFYDTFLATKETNHIDRSLAGLGQYVVCDKFCAIQRNGFSDNMRKHCNYDSYLAERTIFGRGNL